MGEKSLIDIKLDKTDVDRLRETRTQNARCITQHGQWHSSDVFLRLNKNTIQLI